MGNESSALVKFRRGTQRGQLTANNDSMDSFLMPPTPDRKRSRSLCATQMIHDTQAAVAQKMQEDSRNPGTTGATTMTNGGRKTSTGLVPSLNRLRIQQCFKVARRGRVIVFNGRGRVAMFTKFEYKCI
ncbi:hypothetical protein NECAME_15023 [Necator americanus]|uniref:Uncharacterized protein n=1 Tax=Necator americanus TaxID=51031 RepID=W2SMH9_NECAM|nr:hypothetical protein NECAME_15023 [Necator americanus]ETN69922.1 hypothetical protein NECAME_15023 [Necator americanus]